MSTLVSQIAVIAIIALVMVVVLSLFGIITPKNKREVVPLGDRKDDGKNTDAMPTGGARGKKTEVMALWVMEQFDSTGKVVKTFEISNIPKKGLLIGIASDCDFRLEPYRFIGKRHAIIAEDDKGMFILDNNSTNGMFDSKQEKVKQIDITSGVELYLGNSKIRFRAINPFKEVYVNDVKEKSYTTVKRLH